MKIRIYYEDTDCGNVVYYANYLRFMERSRTEFLRERGIDLADFHAGGITFVVAEAHVKYHSSAKYNDLLDVVSRVTETKAATMVFSTDIKNGHGTLCAQGWVRLACVDATGRVRRMPQELLDAAQK